MAKERHRIDVHIIQIIPMVIGDEGRLVGLGNNGLPYVFTSEGWKAFRAA